MASEEANYMEQNVEDITKGDLQTKPKKKRGKKKKKIVVPENAEDNANAVNDSDDDGSAVIQCDLTFTTDTVDELGNVIQSIHATEDGCTEFEEDQFGKCRVVTDAMPSKSPEILDENETVNFGEYEKEEKIEIVDKTPQDTSLPNLSLNKKALPRYAKTYELEKFEKNYLLIFNQRIVEGYDKERLGTEKDEEALINTFTKFGFECDVCRDKTKKEIFDKLNEFSKIDYTDYGCVAIAILTHGTKFGTLYARDEPYGEIEVVNYLKVHNKPSLVTKPRLLIVQACRGSKISQAAFVNKAGKIRSDHEESKEPYTLPVESDILVLHSSYVGKLSLRSEVFGSWFIQTLCKKIDELASTEDLLSIMTAVKLDVAAFNEHRQHNRRTLETDIYKQMPVTTSTLVRKLYLRNYGDDPPLMSVVDYTSQPSTSSNVSFDAAAYTSTAANNNCSQACLIDRYNYVIDCLKSIAEQYPEDKDIKPFLALANTFEDRENFYESKRVLFCTICSYLNGNKYKYDGLLRYVYLNDNH